MTKFKNKYPKQEVTLEFDKKTNLARTGNVTVHYRHYQGHSDTLEHYTLEGDRNAWYEIKPLFFYDKLMNKVKDTYKDSFDREMKVTKLK